MTSAKKEVSRYASFIKANQIWGHRFIQEHLNRYDFASKFVAGKTVLDLGCGIGYGSLRMLRSGARTVTGGDLSLSAIGTATERSRSSKDIHFVNLDGTKLPLEGDTFDVIVAFEVIEHIPAYESFLAEVRRCLKPGGVFVCSTPNKEVSSPGSEKPSVPEHFKEFYIQELQDILGTYFDDVTVYGQEIHWQQGDSLKARLATLAKPVVGYLPALQSLVNLITRFTFREYRLVHLEDVETLDERYAPVLLVETDGDCRPLHILTVARKPGRV